MGTLRWTCSAAPTRRGICSRAARARSSQDAPDIRAGTEHPSRGHVRCNLGRRGLTTPTTSFWTRPCAALAAPPGLAARPVHLTSSLYARAFALHRRADRGGTGTDPSSGSARRGAHWARPRDAGCGHWATTSCGIIAQSSLTPMPGTQLAVDQVQAVRDVRRSCSCRSALHYLAHINLAGRRAGPGSAAQIDDPPSIADATGNRQVAYTELALAAFRGREAEASALIRNTIRTANANGQGRIVSFATYASAVLYNGLGRYGSACGDAARRVIDAQRDRDDQLANIAEFPPKRRHEPATAASCPTMHRAWIHEGIAATLTDWATGIEARIDALRSVGAWKPSASTTSRSACSARRAFEPNSPAGTCCMASGLDENAPAVSTRRGAARDRARNADHDGARGLCPARRA